MMRNLSRGPIPLIGGATVTLEQAAPRDLVHAIREYMPGYAQMAYQHVVQHEAIMAEIRNMLAKVGVTTIRRAPSQQQRPPEPIDGGGNGDGIAQ